MGFPFAVCSLLQLSLEDYIEARDGLVGKDLIAFDGTIFQVLDLPKKSLQDAGAKEDRLHIRKIIQQSLWEAEGGR
jgi:hypothetical protein